MTNKEKYRQAFSVLHASGNIVLEESMKTEKTFRPSRKLVSLCVCAALLLALGVTAYAYGDEIAGRIFGWGHNLEITQGTDENGASTGTAVLYTDSLTISEPQAS